MKYELALKLKEAGFPQNSSFFKVHKEKGESFCLTTSDTEPDYWEREGWVCSPSLSYLIELCGNEPNFVLMRLMGKWNAGTGKDHLQGTVCENDSDTPEEAVARLWLLLNAQLTS